MADAFPGKPPARVVKPSLQEVTDWYVSGDLDKSSCVVYPGAFEVSVDDSLAQHAAKLREIVLWRQGQENDELRDWRIEYQGISFRAHKQRTVDGVMYMLRRISTELPNLDDLGLPKELTWMFTHPRFSDAGGLVLVTGGPGHGKSTTAAAIVVARVRIHGSFCLTVEDPPEFSLHGDHMTSNGCIGKVVQVPANSESFAIDLKDAMRCYPSNMRGSMLMVGEVRDGDTAAQLLRAAVNGQLVVATMHAAEPIGALERLLALAKDAMGADEAKSLLAHSLRVVLSQRLLKDVGEKTARLRVEALVSSGSSCPVGSRISSEHTSLKMLSSEFEHQQLLLRQGRLMESPSAMGIVGGARLSPVAKGVK